MITGGTSGIGFAIAERFLREGADKVILVGRSRERLDSAACRLLEGSSSILQHDEDLAQPDVTTAVPVPARVSLLSGDVTESTSSWLRELERELVCLFVVGFSCLPENTMLNLGRYRNP